MWLVNMCVCVCVCVERTFSFSFRMTNEHKRNAQKQIYFVSETS